MWSRRRPISAAAAVFRIFLHKSRHRMPNPTPPSLPDVFSRPHSPAELQTLLCRHVSGIPARFLCSNGGPREESRCWNCNEAASTSPFLACGHCRSVQPVNESVNYFQIFGMDKSYEIGENLEGKYKDWQKKLHPDLVHSKSEKEKNFAAEQSARVIDAYRTLSKPLSRALYLLKLEGIHVDEEKTLTDPELLAEMMEMREAVEEANDQQTLKQIQTEIERKFDTWSSSFQQALKINDFEDAITATQRMRYYERALEEIVKKTD